MIGMTLKNAIHEIIKKNSTATFLVDGDTLQGDICSYKCPSSAKFIFVRDYMATGTAAPVILSKEFIAMRTEAWSNPYDTEPYTTEKYEVECASVLRELSEIKPTDIILIQFDCYVSQIWQLTMQAYIEQLGIANKVKRLCFYDDCKSDFYVSHFDEIDIKGAHEAYCQLVCRHEPRDLMNYLIDAEAVECYLDINSPTGPLREYICKTSSTFESPYHACGIFFRDYPKWGLGDGEFIMIAMQTLSQNPKYAETVKKWKRILKRR